MGKSDASTAWTMSWSAISKMCQYQSLGHLANIAVRASCVR